MEMHQVRYFLAVCDTLNFTRAAERCNVAQPSLTKAVKKLEEELGGELFRRERSQTHLTELGRLMQPHLETIYDASMAAEEQAKGFHTLDHASVSLGVMSTIGPTRMVDFMARLKEEMPNLELTVREAKGTDLVEALLEGELEVALIGLPNLPDRLDARPLYTERYTVAFAKGHPFEGLNAVPVERLDGEDYLLRLHCEFMDHFAALGGEDDLRTNILYRSEREDWVQAMVLAQMGCAIMPEFLPTLPGIATRPVVEPEVSRTISLVTVAGRRFSPALQTLIRLAQRFPWPG